MSFEDQEKPELFKMPAPLVIHPLEPIPLGRYRQSWFQKITDTLASWIFFALVIGGGLYYCVHLVINYRKVQAEIHEKASRVVEPRIEDGSVPEIGYIFLMRKESSIRDARFNLVWFISVPATGERYSCSYEGGFQDFKVGDGVTLIHPKSDDGSVDHSSYIVGLHDKEQGKSSLVGVNNLEELEIFGDG